MTLPDNWLETWKAERAAAAAKTAHRRVPMPSVPAGVCRWCERTIVAAKGKHIGKPDPRRSWCRGEGERQCWKEYLRHIDAQVQYGFIARRDGDQCAQCVADKAPPRFYREGPECAVLDWSRGALDQEWLRCLWSRDDAPDCRWLGLQTPVTNAPGLQVDHITPLWKVALMTEPMTLAQRRWWFGPENLQLLCRHHHAAKSKAEAAERAAIKRRSSGR